MKSVLILISIFSSQAFAKPAAEVLKEYFDNATEAASLTDIDEKDASKDSPQKCVYATVGGIDEDPTPGEVFRQKANLPKKNFGPLFRSSEKEQYAVVFGLPGTRSLDDSQVLELAKSMKVSKEKDYLLLELVDPGYSDGNFTVRLKLNEKNLVYEIKTKNRDGSGGTFSTFYGYCYRE
jgi:hypothetical protein